jgi:hypothetical protein
VSKPAGSASTKHGKASPTTPANPKTEQDGQSEGRSDRVARGKLRLGDQVKILSRFLYLLGGVAQGFERVDEAIARHEASAAVIQQTQKNKVTVKNSLRNLREALGDLERDFSSVAELRKLYLKLAGVTAAAVMAEQQAADNQFSQAGNTLLGVFNRLVDALNVQP